MSKLLWKALIVSPAVLGATLLINVGSVRAAGSASLGANDSQTATSAVGTQTPEDQKPEVQPMVHQNPAVPEAAEAVQKPEFSTSVATQTLTGSKIADIKLPAKVSLTPTQLTPTTQTAKDAAPEALPPATDPKIAQITPASPNNADVLRQINRYSREGNSASQDQVTNVSQLSDVRPTDWAYEALRSLVERYGCIAGYPDRSFRGNRAMTRYEFAAGLNSCLQQIERLIAGGGSDRASKQDLETLRRLVSEFQSELTALGKRVDQLEGRTAFMEDHQFSTTTKLFGQAIFGAQGRSENQFKLFLDRQSDPGTNINLVDNVQLSLFTQFSPRSLLLTGLAAGNGNDIGTPLENYVGLGYQSGVNNNLQVSDLNFRQLISNKFALIFGPVGVDPVDVFRGVNRVESAGQGPLSRFAQRNPIINIGGRGGGIGFWWQIASRMSLQGVYSANF